VTWSLHRIDDRLIHGQVVVAWGQRVNPRTIWVVDDESAASAWERDLLESAAPGVEVKVLRVAEAIAGYAGEAERRGAGILLVRDLATARSLVEGGLPIPSFNVGGLHYAVGKDKINEYVYLDAADRDDARALLDRGVTLVVQDVPASRPQDLAQLDPAIATP